MARTAPLAYETTPRPRSLARRLGRLLVILIVMLVVVVLGGGLYLRHRMHASLAQLDGAHSLPGLGAAVTIERDALGVPTIRGANRLDVARALGFLHGQERFFQMDLLRRRASGELAEILGASLVKLDIGDRVHRFRAVAQNNYQHAAPERKALLDAYAAGVNAGLAALDAPPFEYLLLRSRPVPWRPEDSILVVEAMFLDLQASDIDRESRLGLMHDTLPPAFFDFLTPRGTEWDAPLVGGPLPVPPLPGPEVIDLRQTPVPPAAPAPAKAAALAPAAFREAPREVEEALLPGSNNWAVAGSHTADGRALLADDMHLGLRMPNIWYRASLVWPADGGNSGSGGKTEHRVTGVTLPGQPIIVAGSTGHVAWGFTNSYGDFTDLIVMEIDPARPDFYRTPEGFRPFVHNPEVIRVHGGKPRQLDVLSTIWGPVVDHDHLGRPRALAWTAHRAEAINMEILGLEDAKNIDEAIAIAHRSGLPAQNFTVADESGRIGWTVIGRIPHRVGFDGRLPGSWADGSRRWDGWVAPEAVPQILDPPSGRLWTANNRTLDGEGLSVLGDGGYDLGARARQIRDDLMAIDKATPRDLLAIQLDDRALFLTRWRDLLLKVLTPEAVAGHPRRAELRHLVETTWNGHAAAGSVAYRIVRAFRTAMNNQVFAALTVASSTADPKFQYGFSQSEGPLWQLVTERPPHLLSPRFHTWDEQLLAGVDAAIGRLSQQGPDLSKRVWGEVNLVALRHPMSPAVPFLSRWLDLRPRQLPGDVNMPRVQGAGFGASERLVVSPGHEEQGLFEMPAGESGNPASPHYRDSNPAWVQGEPAPFLPGPAVNRLTLTPLAPLAPLTPQ
jgi:penicillin amidase